MNNKSQFCVLLFTVLLFCVSLSFAYENCHSQDFGNGATVCVCNSTNCDRLPKVEKSVKGQVQMFVTNKQGDRMLKIIHYFDKKKSPEYVHHKPGQPHHIVDSETEPKIGHHNYQRITINHNKKYQKIIGFGGAFTDAAGINIAKLDKELQKSIIEDYFGEDGIEYTMGRIPIGGSDFSTRPYTYDDHDDDFDLEKFALQDEDLKFKIPYLLMAQEVSKNKLQFFGSPWGAPTWMKTNHEANHGGFLIGQPGGKYYKTWAKYFVKFIQEYEKKNVSIWGLTIENEPGAGYIPTFRWNSLGFNATLQRDFLKMDLGPILAEAGFGVDKVKMMIFDDQLPNLKAFTTTVLEDHEAAKYASGIAFHWYQNYKGNREDLDCVAKAFPDKFILNTEACEEWRNHKEHVSLGNWATVNRYADDIIKDLNHHTSGWIDWNLVLDMQGGPNWVQNFVDAPIIVNPDKKEYYKQPFFYALGHFSKFLPPNSVKIHHEESLQDDKLLVTVFQRPDNGTVMIILNKHDTDEIVVLDDPDNGKVYLTIPQESIQSFVWYN